MALKLSTSRGAVPMVACSEESLLESIEGVSAASEALFEAQADGAELCQVLDNLALTAEALENGGLTAEFLQTFNSEGETMAAAGVEALTVEGLEALGDSQVKRFEDKVAAGLEGKIAEYWAKFIAWLKNLWVRLQNWFKAIWTNRARYVKALDAAGTLNKDSYNTQAKVTGYTKADLTKAWADHEALCSKIEEFRKAVVTGKTPTKAFEDKDSKAIKDFMDKQLSESTVGNLFGTPADFGNAVAAYKNAALSKKVQDATKYLTEGLSKLIKDAGEASKAEGAAAVAAKDTINKKREAIQSCLALIRLENAFVMRVGSSLAKVLKAAQTKKESK